MPYHKLLDGQAREVTATDILRLALLFASSSRCRDANYLDQNGRIQAK